MEKQPEAAPRTAAGPGLGTKLAYGCLSILASFAGLLVGTIVVVAAVVEAFDLDPDVIFLVIPPMYIAWPFLAYVVYRRTMTRIRREREGPGARSEGSS